MALGNAYTGGGLPLHGSGSHTPSGVTPGTYNSKASWTVNLEGAVTFATNVWNATIPYLANQDAVGSNSSLYRAVISSTGVNPTTDDGTHWVAIRVPNIAGATNGQVPVWNGTDWLPGTVGGAGGGMPTGSDLQFAQNNGVDPWVSVTLSRDVVAFNNSGALSVQGINGVRAGLISWAATDGRIPLFNGTSLESVVMSNDATIVGSGVITLKNVGTAGTNGSASKVPVFVTDAQGRVSSNTDTDIAISATQITAGQLALARGGTHADLSATGGTGQYLKQSTVGGNVSVGTIASGDLPSLAGDVSGAPGANTVDKVKNVPIGTWTNAAGRLPVFDGANLLSVVMSGDATIGATGVVALKNTGTAGVKGSASQVPVFTTDAQGRVTADTDTAIAISASQITSGLLALARGGTHVDLSGTGGTSQVLQQATVGGDITVGQLNITDITNGGTVTNFSANDLIPLFTTTEATPTTTPVLSFALTSAAQNALFAGPSSGGTGAPSYRAQVPLDWAPGSATGALPYASSATVNSWRTIGSTGDVLTVSGGVPTWAAPATSGTVTSVGLSVPSWLTVANSPITSSGTLAVTATAGQTANSFVASPDNGTGAVSVRVIVSRDLAASPLAGKMLYATSATAMAWSAAGADTNTIAFVGTVPTPNGVITNNLSTVSINPAAANVGLTINGVSGQVVQQITGTPGANIAALQVQTDNNLAVNLISTGSNPGIRLQTNVTPVNGTVLGALLFRGKESGGGNINTGADMFGQAVETHSSTAAGTRLVFRTVAPTTLTLVNRVFIDALGNAVLNASAAENATSATSPFIYAGSCNGIPTGVPTSSYTGTVPIIIDRADNRLYAYIASAWQNLSSGSGSPTLVTDAHTTPLGGDSFTMAAATDVETVDTSAGGLCTLTLSTIAARGVKAIWIKRKVGGIANLVINAGAGNTIDGVAATTLTGVSGLKAVQLVPVGTDWQGFYSAG